MNGELPPVDPGIREQLARRSAGRLPEGLLADVSSAVDAVSLERPARLRLGPVALGAPRLAAAASLALVFVIAAALVVVPRIVTSPPGNATYGALTTAELASLLAAKTPPAMNTTIVATVTVDARNDVCPMNRYPTLGVIEGMTSQVCVMGADLMAYLDQPPWSNVPPAARATGTFAFRYLAPGYLGLLGRLTLPTDGIAFRATDDWPLQGKTFLVEGWLGADELMESCATTPTAGDVLVPNGDDCPYDNWLGADSTAPGIAADHWYAPSSPQPSFDTLALRGNARHVQAGGMRIIDGIDYGAPVHGVFVTRSVTSACPYSSPVDSRGCGVWRVLARVSDTSLHAPTATPTPTPAPMGVYPTDRALTTDELARLLAGPQPAVNTALVASVAIDPQPDACPMKSRPTYGVVHGIDPQICVVGPIGDTGSVATGQNVFAFRYMGPGVLGLLGLIQPASSSKLAHSVADDWSQAGKVILIDGWLGEYPYACSVAFPTPTITTGGDPLNPDGAIRQMCRFNWLSDDPTASATPSQDGPPGGGKFVAADGVRLIDDISPEEPIHGVFVVRLIPNRPCERAFTAGDGCALILARISDVTIPKASPPPAPLPTPTPTAAAPATPVPPATPTIPGGGSPVGLFGDGNRPLTQGEFAALWAADQAHLAGRIVIAKGPVPTGFECWSAGAADASASPGTCHIAILDGRIAQEGYWAIRVGADGKLSIVGELSTPESSFVFTLAQVNASTSLKAGDLVVVDAWLVEYVPTCDRGATPLPSACGPYSALESTASDNSPASLYVQQGAFEKFTGSSGDWTVDGPPVHGLFLVRVTNQNGGTLLARLEPASLP